MRLNLFQEARQEVMNRAMELSEVEEGIREAQNAAKVNRTRFFHGFCKKITFFHLIFSAN